MQVSDPDTFASVTFSPHTPMRWLQLSLIVLKVLVRVKPHNFRAWCLHSQHSMNRVVVRGAWKKFALWTLELNGINFACFRVLFYSFFRVLLPKKSDSCALRPLNMRKYLLANRVQIKNPAFYTSKLFCLIGQGRKIAKTFKIKIIFFLRILGRRIFLLAKVENPSGW